MRESFRLSTIRTRMTITSRNGSPKGAGGEICRRYIFTRRIENENSKKNIGDFVYNRRRRRYLLCDIYGEKLTNGGGL